MAIQMSSNGSTAGVIVRQSGHDARVSQVPSGMSLADVLRSLGIAPEDHDVLVDGRSLAEVFSPSPGSVVTIFRKSEGGPSGVRPAPSIGQFADEPLFEAMMENVRTAREAERGGT